jgi:hypothetical protein
VNKRIENVNFELVSNGSGVEKDVCSYHINKILERKRDSLGTLSCCAVFREIFAMKFSSWEGRVKWIL